VSFCNLTHVYVYIVDASADRGLVYSIFPGETPTHDGVIGTFTIDPTQLSQPPPGIESYNRSFAFASRIVSLAYDYRRHAVFGYDIRQRVILKTNNFNIWLNDTNEQTSIFHDGISGEFGQIAVDWVAGNVYWTDAFYDWIAVQQEDAADSGYRVLVHENLMRPMALALDPRTG
jgi:hypothetical protein